VQPSIDPGAVARRPLDYEDYIDIVRRHKAWILGPTFAGLVLGVVIAFLWPDTYVSRSTIKVIPQQVPEAFVASNTVMEMSSRINAMAQSIVSRANLTNIITSYNLYPRERSREPMEDILENMKKKVHISQVMVTAQGGRQSVPAFTIDFSYEQRALAQKVVTDLASRFIDESLREHTEQSEQTTKFLSDEWDKSAKDLKDQESKLANFRMSHAGKLPEQMTTAMSQLNAYDQRVANLQMALQRASQDKLLLESQRKIYESQLRSLAPPQDQVQMVAKNERVAEMERSVEQAETQLAALRERYKDNYPEVQQAQSTLNVLKRKRDEVLKEETSTKPSAAPAKSVNPNFLREQREMEANVARIDGLVKAKDQEMEDIRKDIVAANSSIKTVQERVNQAPTSDREYSELVRDRDLAKQRYEDLTRRKNQSELGTQLVKRSQGERLELLDPASLPITPSEPKRPLIVGAVCAIGLVAGFMLAGAREVRNTSLKNLKDVRAYTQLNILGVAPLLENDLVVRRRKRLAYLAWSTAILVGCFIMAGSVFYYFNFRT
jgi:polysaccharide biosynthesis transport protein